MNKSPKTFYRIDYKGKYFTIEDEVVDEVLDVIIGKISKEEALKPEFIKEHKANCLYYGIPPVITSDKDLKKAYE